MEVCAILNGLLRSTIRIMELTGRRWNVGDLVRQTDEVAAAAPPHHEFAVAEATRAWACGDLSAMRDLSSRDLSPAVHTTAVGIAVLGSSCAGQLAPWRRRPRHPFVTSSYSAGPMPPKRRR